MSVTKNNKLVFRTLLVFLFFLGLDRVWSQSERLQNLQVRSQDELIAALLKTQNDRPDEIAKLLDENSELLSESFWQEIVDSAGRSYYQNEQARAFQIYNIARSVALKLNDQKLVAKTWYYIGRSHSGVNEFDKAKSAYLESKRAFESAGLQRALIDVLSDLGTLSLIQEDYTAAREYSESSIRLSESLRGGAVPLAKWPDTYGEASAQHTLGELAALEGNISEAIEYLQRSIALYEQLNKEGYDYYIADAYASLGRVYTLAGHYLKALAVLNKALVISKSTGNQNQQASLLNSIGFLYMEQEDYAQAETKFQASLNLYRLRKNLREESRVLLNLGVIEQRQEKYDAALVRFKLSFESAKASGNIDVQIAAGEGIGVALTGRREFSRALEALSASLAIAKRTKNKIRLIELIWRAAEIYLEIGNYTRSTELAQTALTMAHELHAPKMIYLATTTLGRSYAAEDKKELAAQTLKAAIEQVEAMRNQVAGLEQSRQLFFEDKLTSYHSLIELLTKQGKVFEALVYSEQAKGRVLFDIVSGGRADLVKVLTLAERSELQNLNRQIAQINNRIRLEESGGTTSLESTYQQLDRARLEYRSLQDTFYVAHPDLKLRSGQTPTLSKADLKDLTMYPSAAYLEYVVAGKQVYLFVLTRRGNDEAPELNVYPIAFKSDDLESKVDQFHKRLADRHPDFASLARELYDALVDPAAKQLRGISTLCIIPDDFLWSLPFQALINPSHGYLIEDHAVYYAHSLSLLRITKERVRRNNDSSLIAFGNPVVGRDESRNQELCPLPDAEAEVTSIAKALGSSPTKIFIGRQASERTFKALAPFSGTIHLATHGVIDNRNPLFSYLVLTKTEGADENDGRLEAREIMNLNLDADLAVLSACETATGRIALGEGVMGMSWAFFVAGTRSLLVSQWKVNSLGTSKLMPIFYQSLNSDQNPSHRTKARALQKATLRLIKDQRYQHPFYWAGFVLMGTGI